MIHGVHGCAGISASVRIPELSERCNQEKAVTWCGIPVDSSTSKGELRTSRVLVQNRQGTWISLVLIEA